MRDNIPNSVMCRTGGSGGQVSHRHPGGSVLPACDRISVNTWGATFPTTRIKMSLTWGTNTHTHTHTHIYIHIRTHSYKHTLPFLCDIYKLTHIYAHMHTHKHIHFHFYMTYINTHTHTPICTHSQTHTSLSLWSSTIHAPFILSHVTNVLTCDQHLHIPQFSKALL